MGIHSLNAQPGVDYVAAGEVATGAKLQEGFTALTGGDFEQRHMKASTTTVITKGSTAPASPTAYDYWDDGSFLYRYSGSGWEKVDGTVSATAPSTTTAGKTWLDTTLGITRIYGTVDGVVGWHPTNSVDVLVKNDTGTAMVKGAVVIQTPGSGVRNVQTTTAVKDLRVAGVLLEAIADGLTGVMRRNVRGAVVSILADDGSADGAIAAGDVLATYSVAGECRTVGPQIDAAYQAADHGRVEGLQLGGFAVAQDVKDGTTHLVPALMLGDVGRGMTVWRSRQTAVGSLTADGAWNEVDITSSLLTSSKHAPIAGAWISAQLEINTGSAAWETFQASVNQNAWIAHTFSIVSGTPSTVPMAFCPTSSGAAASYDALGPYLSYNISNAGTPTYTSKALYSHGYVC